MIEETTTPPAMFEIDLETSPLKDLIVAFKKAFHSQALSFDGMIHVSTMAQIELLKANNMHLAEMMKQAGSNLDAVTTALQNSTAKLRSIAAITDDDLEELIKNMLLLTPVEKQAMLSETLSETNMKDSLRMSFTMLNARKIAED